MMGVFTQSRLSRNFSCMCYRGRIFRLFYRARAHARPAVVAAVIFLLLACTISGASAQVKGMQAGVENKNSKAGVEMKSKGAAGDARVARLPAAGKTVAGGKESIGLGWVLHQNTPYSPYSGSQTVIVSPRGMKTVAGDITVLIQPPAYKIRAFNTDTMLTFEASVAQWSKEMKHLKKAGGANKLKKVGSGTICGVQVDRYLVLGPSGKTVIREMAASKTIGVPRQVASFWAAICGIPAEVDVDKLDLGMPLKVVRIYPEGRRETLLDTLRIDKTMLTAANLASPAGCKPVKSAMELVLSAKDLVGDDSSGASPKVE